MINVSENKFKSFFKKFKYAIRGLFSAIKEEKSLIVHIIISVLVLIIAGIINAEMKIYDWIILVIVIFLVIGMELINTAIENLVDTVSFKYNINARKIKDVAAATTLLFAIMAVIVGLLIFIPKFINIINNS